FSAGGATDPSDRPGVADLTYRVMLEGAGAHSALALAEAFGDLGTSPAILVQPDGAMIGLQVLTRNADPALALIAGIVQRPRLPLADFERRREERRADLLAREQDPRAAGTNTIASAVYGAHHPYGHPSAGTSGTLPSVGHRDVRAFYQRWVGPKAAALVVTGDVTLAQATA